MTATMSSIRMDAGHRAVSPVVNREALPIDRTGYEELDLSLFTRRNPASSNGSQWAVRRRLRADEKTNPSPVTNIPTAVVIKAPISIPVNAKGPIKVLEFVVGTMTGDGAEDIADVVAIGVAPAVPTSATLPAARSAWVTV